MSRILQDRIRPEPKPKGVRYPWSQWFRRGAFVLVRGQDYQCQPHGMVSAVRYAAKAHRIRVNIEVDDGKLTVRVVQPTLKTRNTPRRKVG